MGVRKIVLTCLMFMLVLGSYAQQKEGKWWIVPELGLQAGSYEPSGDIRLNGGINYKGWLIGVGGGLDYYRFKSYPIYVQTRKFIGNKRLKPFVFASAGINIPEETSVSKTSFWLENTLIINNLVAFQPTIYTYKPGAYGELGFGYALLNKKNRGLMMSFSYTQKNLSELYPNQISNGTIGGVEDSKEKQIYYMKRWCLRISYLIGN
ncbi:MAG: hypothetical protein K9I82_05990 [Chitinophagaceae bacterium]|nr:hypothetical protein [Chitinophagaceae bacterium]